MLFVKLSSHKKVSAGAGRGGPQSFLQGSSCRSHCRLTQPAPRLLSFHEERPHLYFLRCPAFPCAVPRMGKAHSPNFLQEYCGLTQPAPEVPFLSKRKEPKIRQRGGILFGNTSEGHIPSGTSRSEVLSPCLLRQREDVKYFAYYFGQQGAFVERSYRRYAVGVSKGACPFRWKSKNQEVFGVLFVKLSSHKKVSAGAGCVSPQKQ